jgi:membrane protease subunit HflC
MISLVAFCFGAFLFLFQIEENQHVIISRFGDPQIHRDTTPGLCRRLPYPIEEVWQHDKRIQVYPPITITTDKSTTPGNYEEILTADKINVIVTVFLNWRVLGESPKTVLDYKQKVGNPEEAHKLLSGIVRAAKEYVIGRHSFGELINSDPEKVQISKIEAELLTYVKAEARKLYSIDVVHVGISHLGLPEGTTEKVFERMKAERERVAKGITSRGKAEAEKIKAEADGLSKKTLTEAQAEATKIRAEGEKLAAESYRVFSEDPELALFLRQLTALKIVGKDANIVLDTETPPLNLMTRQAFDNLVEGKLGDGKDVDKALRKQRKKK